MNIDDPQHVSYCFSHKKLPPSVANMIMALDLQTIEHRDPGEEVPV